MAYAVQNSRQKAKLGKKAPWYAVWTEGGRKRWQKVGKKSDAIEIAQSHELNRKKRKSGIIPDVTWTDFQKQYEDEAVPQMRASSSREVAVQVLDRFAEVAKPGHVGDVTFNMLNNYVNTRMKERGKVPGSTLSAASIKKELRTIRAALSFALASGMIPSIPLFPSPPGFETEKRHVTPEHLDAMLAHLDAAKFPRDAGYPASGWWDALLTMLWFAPNRIQSILTLHWDDIDLEAGTVRTRATDTKQKRTHVAQIPAVVVEKLKVIRRFSPVVFPWPHGKSTLYHDFFRIQKAAGIKLHCDGDHECTTACQFYGFHDFRRSFATFNELNNLPASFVQSQMGHSTFATTMKYIQASREQVRHVDQCVSTPGMRAAGVQ
jgi:integrase